MTAGRSSVAPGSVLAELQEYLLGTFLRGSRAGGLTGSTRVLDSGLLDSMAMLELVVHLEETYDIRIAADEVTAATFGTLGAIALFTAGKVSGA